jgi:hypothetical protein
VQDSWTNTSLSLALGLHYIICYYMPLCNTTTIRSSTQHFNLYHMDPTGDYIVVTIPLSLSQCLSYRESNGEIGWLGLWTHSGSSKINDLHMVASPRWAALLFTNLLSYTLFGRNGGTHCCHRPIGTFPTGINQEIRWSGFEPHAHSSTVNKFSRVLSCRHTLFVCLTFSVIYSSWRTGWNRWTDGWSHCCHDSTHHDLIIVPLSLLSQSQSLFYRGSNEEITWVELEHMHITVNLTILPEHNAQFQETEFCNKSSNGRRHFGFSPYQSSGRR